MRCKDCQHWEERTIYKSRHTDVVGSFRYTYNDTNNYVYDSSVECGNKKSIFGMCNCKKLAYGYPFDKKEYNNEVNEQTPDMLLYCDGEEYSAFFYTGKDFGCIHFKPKEIL